MNRIFIPLTLTAPPPVDAAAPTECLTGLSMGTTWTVKLIRPAGTALQSIQHGIQQQLDQVVAQMSHWCEQADLSRYNSAPAETWQVVPEPMLRVLDCALAIAEQSGGAYDPSVGPLVNVWGFGPTPRRSAPPSAAAVAQARQHCGWQRIQIDRVQKAVWQPGGLHLDFSAIAKGYGVDLVVDYLRGIGVASYLVEVGGELRGFGVKADGQPWWVGLEQPSTTDNDVLGIVALHGMALATSGDYRRYFEHGGQRYSHTIDPRTALPVAHRLVAVTVLHADCMTADAWATALMVLGEVDGVQVAQRMQLAALFVWRDGAENGNLRESMTSAMQAMLA